MEASSQVVPLSIHSLWIGLLSPDRREKCCGEMPLEHEETRPENPGPKSRWPELGAEAAPRVFAFRLTKEARGRAHMLLRGSF
jgi:hypothetical protein